MPRPATVDPQEIIAIVRSFHPAPGGAAEAARKFKISRVYVGQVIAAHAPELASSRARPAREEKAVKALAKKQREMIAATKKALRAEATHAAAARALGMTASGLYSRMRRFGIER